MATDNLGSVSFGKYWGNAQGYAQMLNLKAGEQTLRFEVNSAGFELTNLKIEKLTQAIEVSDTLDQTTTITADKVVDGSKKLVGELKVQQLKILVLDLQELIKIIILM